MTPEHPFNVVNEGWVEAGKLSVGAVIHSLDGQAIRVQSVEQEAQRQDTYNFEVADYHTYFVGELGTWVHNMCWKSIKQFGHTFSEHGAGLKNTRRLIDRAREKNTPQGQWLDNEKVANYLSSFKVDEPVSVRIPDGLGQVIYPNGNIKPAGWANIIPNPRTDGLRTAYPIIP